MSTETSYNAPIGVELLKKTPLVGVGLDDLTSGRIQGAIRETGLVFLSMSLEQSLQFASAPTGPAVFIVPWVESKADAIERFSRSLHSAFAQYGCRVLTIADAKVSEALQRVLQSTVDDILVRPFGQDLASRLHVASLVATRPHARSPQDVLTEAIERGVEGEIAISAGSISAGIHVQGGCVVWAHLSDEPASLEEIFGKLGIPLDADVLRDVHAECARAKRHFVEVMVSWNLLEEPIAREAARVFVAGRLQRILSLPSAVAVLLPRPTRAPERIRFRVSEMPSSRGMGRPRISEVSGLGADSSPSRSNPMIRLTQLANLALAIEGASGVALLDRHSGTVILELGAALDSATVCSHLGSLSVYGPSAEELMVTASGECRLLRPVDSLSDTLILVTFRLDSISHGLARVSLARVLEQFART